MDEKINNENYGLASLCQFNEKAEADAITYYNDFLQALAASDIPKAKKMVIESEIYEIISDELNHQEKLRSIYTAITGIKANKD